MKSCISCGREHRETIENDVFLIYLAALSKTLSCRQSKQLSVADTPCEACADCVKKFRRFLDIRMPLLAAEFALEILREKTSKAVNSEATKEGLRRAVAAGKILGRPKKYDDAVAARVVFLRENGMSYRQISKQLNLPCGPTVPRLIYQHEYNRRKNEVRAQ